jgi:hypothetical protein
MTREIDAERILCLSPYLTPQSPAPLYQEDYRAMIDRMMTEVGVPEEFLTAPTTNEVPDNLALSHMSLASLEEMYRLWESIPDSLRSVPGLVPAPAKTAPRNDAVMPWEEV